MRCFAILSAATIILSAILVSSSVAEEVFESADAELVLSKSAGEGPAWDPERGLFFSGGGGITLFDRAGNSKTFLDDAGSNGLLFDHQGRLLICQPKYRRVSRYYLSTGEIRVLTSSFDGKPYNQPNDITVDSKGRIYFSDPKYGPRENMEQLDSSGRPIEGVYRIDLDGRVTRIITHEVDRPNGLVITPNDEYMYVADNNNNTKSGARKLWRFELTTDGNIDLDSQKMLFDWGTGRGPDGMVLDRDGRLYVAGGLSKPNPPYETADKFKGGVYVFSPAGEFLDFVAVPKDEVTNCTFGGSDLRTLYITAGGTLWSIRTKSRGQMPWPKRE